MKRILKYGSMRIEYTLRFTSRKTIRITVTPEMTVVVTAPTGAPKNAIETILQKRASWILRQQEYFLAFYPKQSPKKYVGGESHRYLGRNYRLQIRFGKKESVRLTGRFLHIVRTRKSSVKRLVESWFLDKAAQRIDSIAMDWISHFRRYGVQPTAVVLKKMPKRWGSCTARGKIILNPELIKAPRGCIEYVIIHELCHLIHPNHSQRFIDLQTSVMPTWVLWKARLESIMA